MILCLRDKHWVILWTWCIQQPKVIKIPLSFYMIYDFLFCLPCSLVLKGFRFMSVYFIYFYILLINPWWDEKLMRKTVLEMELERYSELKVLGSLYVMVTENASIFQGFFFFSFCLLEMFLSFKDDSTFNLRLTLPRNKLYI